MKNLIIATFTAAEGNLPGLVASLRERLTATRAFDGCISLHVYHEQDTNTLTLVQDWESQDHYDRYAQWRMESGAEDLLALLEPGTHGYSIRKFNARTDI